jgi:RNA polymerase primary sigma factor
METQLRKSRYLMPSQLVECDLDGLWWLGDTSNRERLPPYSFQLGNDLDQVLELLSRMGKSQATVLRLRFGLDDMYPRTLQEISEGLGLTREQVRRIESDALNKFNNLRARIPTE